MFKRLYVEQSIEGMTENSKEFSATIREDVGNFQQRQIDRYGVLNKKIDFNPISNWVPFVKKKSSIYGDLNDFIKAYLMWSRSGDASQN